MPHRFIEMKKRGEKIAALTAYDATFSALLAAAGTDIILVGDSLGMVIQGNKDTLSVRLSDTLYHVRSVVAGAPESFVIADMPYASYQTAPSVAFRNAAKLLAAGAAMVKMEGGQYLGETIRFLVDRGVPVCAHVGLMPQSVRASGGYRVQGRKTEEVQRITQDALAAQEAGAALIVLELLSKTAAKSISESLTIPTIGIGSGVDCDGQVLVLPDLLGLTAGKRRFVRNFLQDSGSVPAALTAFVKAVKEKTFPADEHSFD